MRKITLSIVIILGLTYSAKAQTKAGVHLGYGTEIERPLIGINAEFNITDKITVAPDFTYYLTKNYAYIKTSMWELNANGHYYFLDKDTFKVFGLAGLNYTSIKVTSDFNSIWLSEVSATDSKIGFNIGGGATYTLSNKIEAFSTLKYTIGSTDQVVLFVGARYIF